MKKIFLIILTAFTNLAAFSQYDTIRGGPVEKFMRSNEKIYVVVAVCLTILIGLILYLISLDRKITKMEKK